MKQGPDLYRELGVAPNASPAEIDKAYRNRARTTHPDAGGSSQAFSSLRRAYDILSDPARRMAYDQTGDDSERGPDNTLARAMQHINELVGAVLDSDLAFEQVDLVAAIRRTLIKQQKEVATDIANLERQAGRAEAMARRFRKMTGDNVIRRALEKRAADFRNRAEVTRKQATVFATAIEVLDDYTFVTDKDPAQPPPA